MSRTKYHWSELAAVFVCAAVLCFSHIHQGTLAVDAIRYGAISQQLVDSGEWFRLIDPYSGLPYAAKPPLLFWINAQLFAWFGFSTFVAKLPAVTFVFGALLAVWLVARRLGAPAALWAVLLVVVNQSFAKDLVDLGFDGMALFGAVCAFAVGRHVVEQRQPPNWRWGVVLGCAVLFLLQSKPPYLLLATAPTLVVLLVQGNLVRVLYSPVFLLAVLFGSIPTVLWFWFAETAALDRVSQRQFSDFLIPGSAVLKNVWAWMYSFFVTMAPLSLLSLVAVVLAVRRMLAVGVRSDPVQLLSVLWCLQVLPVFLLVAVRPRYLWIPLVPGIFLAAGFLAQRFPRIRSVHLQSVLGMVALVTIAMVLGSDKGLHRENPYIAALRKDALRSAVVADRALAFCSASLDIAKRTSTLRHAELLTELEFRRRVVTGGPEQLRSFSGYVLGDQGCREALAPVDADVLELGRGMRFFQLSSK